ncbi:21 kDa protein-like [Wolffia australiana]
MEFPCVLLLLAIAAAAAAAISGGASAAADVDFVQRSCRSTRYPVVCDRTLTQYAAIVKGRPRHLAAAAIGATLKFSTSSAFVVRRHAAVIALRDCLQTLDDSVEMLSQSAAELRRLGPRSYRRRRTNLLTWLSAAVSDHTTCLDGLSGTQIDRHVRSEVEWRVLRLKEMTSIALHFVARLR